MPEPTPAERLQQHMQDADNRRIVQAILASEGVGDVAALKASNPDLFDELLDQFESQANEDEFFGAGG